MTIMKMCVTKKQDWNYMKPTGQ